MSKAIRTATISGQVPRDVRVQLPTRVTIEAVRPFSHAGSDPIYVGAHLSLGQVVMVGRMAVKVEKGGAADVVLACLPQSGIEPADARYLLKLHWSSKPETTHPFALTEDTTWSEIVAPGFA